MRRLRVAVALFTGACAATALVAPAQASVRVHQVFRVAPDGSMTITGHGYGHGHGMSQYGAQGAALGGLTAGAIVAFYYPGTTVARSSPRVRVLLSSNPRTALVVQPRRGLTLTDRGAHRARRLPTNLGATRWRLAVSGSRSVVSYLAHGRWHPWSPTAARTLVGDGDFFAGGAPITMFTSSGPRAYRGTLWAASPYPGATYRRTVNAVNIDGYLQGVVPAEMPASWQPAALQAQAIAARTFALWSVAKNPRGYYQLCDTTACQVYRGASAEYASTNAAVRATAGQYLSYQGQPAFTQFSASSGGWTSDGGQPYLPHQQDPYDAWSGNHVHDWTVSANASQLTRAYPALGTVTSITVTQREGGGDWQGRALSLDVVGTKGSKTITGVTFRAIFGLRSTWFTLS